jgi:hypothetical protein
MLYCEEKYIRQNQFRKYEEFKHIVVPVSGHIFGTS